MGSKNQATRRSYRVDSRKQNESLDSNNQNNRSVLKSSELESPGREKGNKVQAGD